MARVRWTPLTERLSLLRCPSDRGDDGSVAPGDLGRATLVVDRQVWLVDTATNRLETSNFLIASPAHSEGLQRPTTLADACEQLETMVPHRIAQAWLRYGHWRRYGRRAHRSITGYIRRAKTGSDAEVIAGGRYSDEDGFFIRPTIVHAKRPDHETMCDEIFGPVMSIHVYPDNAWSETLDIVDSTSPYALTGAVFSRDRSAVREAMGRLRHAAGNFYINDKPTGAVVGQQPSEAAGHPAPTTRPGPRPTSRGGCRRGASRRTWCLRRATSTRSWQRSSQRYGGGDRRAEVGLEVLQVLESDRDAHETVGDAQRAARTT